MWQRLWLPIYLDRGIRHTTLQRLVHYWQPEKGLRKKDLREAAGISRASIAKLGKNEIVTTEVLAKICTALSCRGIRHTTLQRLVHYWQLLGKCLLPLARLASGM